MKMLRVSFAAILAAVALATDETTASTESPVAVAEHARDSALEHANGTLHEVMRTMQEARNRAGDEDLVDAEVARIESAFPNTTQHYLSLRLQRMRNASQGMSHHVNEQVNTAKASANAYKSAARALEAARRAAGMSERVYEGGYQDDEQLSEGWHDEAENYGDAAHNHIESFFDAVEGKIEGHAEREDDNNRGNEEDDDDDDDGDNNRGNHEHHQQDDQQGNRSDVASFALNLVEEAPTESPVAVAEQARDSALEHANQTLHEVMRTSQEARNRAGDEDLVDAEVARIEAAFPNTTEHYLSNRLQRMHNASQGMSHHVDEQVDTAKAAANAYKAAARALEAARRAAGMSERVYEGGYQDDEQLSEGWHDEAENYGDAAHNHIESFFDAVEGKIEGHAEREEDDDNNRGNEEDDDDNDDGDNNRGNHEEQDDRSDDQDDRDDSDAPAPAPAQDDQQDAASFALNLRAVAQNPRNAGQGFLLTFACIGFLASMAFAVQMQNRRTRSQAREPLLWVHD